jgi:hypothetical protein
MMMEKSFFYRVSWHDANTLRKSLDEIAVPYTMESLKEGELAFVFPDLNGRQYVCVRKLFRGDGLAYPRSGLSGRS